LVSGSWPAPLLILMILAMMVLPLPAFRAGSVLHLQYRHFGDRHAGCHERDETARFLGLPDRAAGHDPAAAVAQRRFDPGRPARRAYRPRMPPGKVIEAFGHFLVGGNYAVGLVVFTILVVINFVVITKGAGRVAEVAARFTLDAMPGKQMAIDADLNAGLIGEEEARRRRSDDRPGSGLLRFDGRRFEVRPRRRRGRHPDHAAQRRRRPDRRRHAAQPGYRHRPPRTYTLLTIGDGLVAQIPALIISIAAAWS
jgi:flagellar biosynthesis protein FlhA